MVKTENELACMRAAAEITHKTFDYVLEKNMTFCADIFLGSAVTETGLRIEDVVCVKRAALRI